MKCVNARLTHDTELFGSMDPYVKVTVGGHTQKTITHNSAGKTPRWEQTLQFRLNGKEDTVRVEVYDEDTVTDDLVGETTYYVDEIKKRKKIIENQLKLSYKGKEAGFIK